MPERSPRLSPGLLPGTTQIDPQLADHQREAACRGERLQAGPADAQVSDNDVPFTLGTPVPF